MGMFKQKPNVMQQLNEQCRRIRSEIRTIDRTIARTKIEQKKVEMELKKASKDGDMDVIRILAKSLVVSRRHVSKLFTTKAQMSSLEMQLKENIAQAKITNSVKCSTEVIKILNSLVSVPEVHKTMTEMSNEMIKMGMIDEMMTDTFDSVMQVEDEDEEIENQVSSVLDEILLTNKSTAVASRPIAVSSKISKEQLASTKDVPNVSHTKENDEERLRQLLSK